MSSQYKQVDTNALYYVEKSKGLHFSKHESYRLCCYKYAGKAFKSYIILFIFLET